MKRGIIILAFAMSCNPKQATEQNSVEVKEGNILENFSMTTDTLMIDMEGEFINFGIPLITSVSVDGDYFFILNYQTLHLQKISLDEMRLTDTLTFKKEGPDSPGFTFTIQPLPENQFFFPSMERPNVINSEAKKVRDWKLNSSEIVKGYTIEPLSVTNRIVFDFNRNQMYSLPMNYESREYFLAILDSTGRRKGLYELKKLHEANQFTIQNGSGEGSGLKAEFPFLQVFNGQVVISCSVGNGIYLFDLVTDSISYRTFPHELVPPQKNGEVKNTVHSEKEFEEELKKLNTQISYWEFHWDDKSQRFFRFASKAKNIPEELNESTFDIYLIAYDRDFHLIGETFVSQLSALPMNPFFKDGKLWSYVNVEDELGFAVMDFKF